MFWSNSCGKKSNEIVAIPILLEDINIKNCVVTIDAMGTQTKIAEQIKKQRGDYILAVKGNQGNLLIDYFSDTEFLENIKSSGNYKKTLEKAHVAIEKKNIFRQTK